jgi:universal stress protein A
MVPVDLTDDSAALVRCAAGLCSRVGGELTILHVYSAEAALAALRESGLFLDLYVARLRSELNFLRAQAGITGLKARVEVLEGEPVPVILTRATEMETDLIVIGTHRRAGLSRLLMGSVAEGVLRRAPCPVVLIPVSILASRRDLAGRPRETAAAGVV